jgi:hypothetical protein
MNPLRFASVLALAAASACSLDTTDRISQPPRLRVVNAAPSTTGVTVHLNQNSTSILPLPLGFEEISELCPLIVDATHQITFRETGDSLAAVVAPFAENLSYMLFLVESSVGSYKAVLASDTETAPAASNGLRFVNATSTAGDVHVTTPGEAPSASSLAVGNLAPLAMMTNPALTYLFRPETATRIRLYNVGTTATARSDITLAGTGGRRLTTIVFTDKTFMEDPGALQVNACP